MASLLITTGPQAGTYFQLAKRPLAAGRDSSRDIQLLDPKVSRKHFLIRHVDGDYVLVPFTSTNAVIVNGDASTDELVLADRDEIQVGDTTLLFRIDDDPDRSNALEKYRVADRRAREHPTIEDQSRET